MVIDTYVLTTVSEEFDTTVTHHAHYDEALRCLRDNFADGEELGLDEVMAHVLSIGIIANISWHKLDENGKEVE